LVAKQASDLIQSETTIEKESNSPCPFRSIAGCPPLEALAVDFAQPRHPTILKHRQRIPDHL
jgi:hypothetical protein